MFSISAAICVYFSLFRFIAKNGATPKTVRKSFFETKTIYQNRKTLQQGMK
jgi:hypothetical protein